MLQKLLIDFSISHPKRVMWITGILTLFFLFAFPNIKIDTDPVHMLPQDHQVIVRYEQMKEEFDIYDLVVVGILKKDGSSLFTVDDLTKIYNFTKEILEVKARPSEPSWYRDLFRTLRFMERDDPLRDQVREIIVTEDVRAPSEVDDIRLNDAGELKVVPLMENPPRTEEEAAGVLKAINDNPVLRGKLVSVDGSLVGIYLPIHKGMKDYTYYLGEEIKRIAEKHLGEGEEFYLAGLPIAENTFGNEMFIQMGLYAPLAGLVIFLLMFFFFRNLQLIIGPMLMAMITVVWAMGALIYSGNTIHIMSSMIPVFLMPIALLDSIHVISHLHDKLMQFPRREEAIRAVMKKLFNPMLYTSLTTTVGFVSLASTGIPPVVVFGIAVGAGVGFAWILTMTFIPACCMLIGEDTLRKFVASGEDRQSIVMKIIYNYKQLSTRFPSTIVFISIGIVLISLVGLAKIEVNDNPVRWFKEAHPIRQADKVMNPRLAGTYMTNLIFDLPLPTQLETEDQAQTEETIFEEETLQIPDLKDGAMVRYMEKIQNFLLSVKDEEGLQIVGGVTSIVDILKKVGTTALNDPRVPDSREKTAQYMFLFESGDLKKGKDMWKFITRDARKAEMCLLLKNGDNQKMNYLVSRLEWFMSQPGNEPPSALFTNGEKKQLELHWSGLTYINSAWQDEMVKGMRRSLIGAFAVVFVMMVVLFRSFSWGLVSMLPLSITILFCYGLIGLSGKYYDMPIAVLSSLTLGLSIDFAIHFNQSFREIHLRTKNISQTFEEIFEEPSRAIWRNVLVIAIGFMPMFFASLLTYATVGAFFFVIMVISGMTTLLLLPSIIRLAHRWLPGLQDSKPVHSLLLFSLFVPAALFFITTPLTLQAEEKADAIMRKSHLASYYAGEDGRAMLAMLVYSKEGSKPLKKIFIMLKKDLEEGGKQNFFIYFDSPSDIRRTTFLVHKFVDKDDYRRLYLPANDKVILIDGSRKQDPFMGSDFSYEDISGRHYSKDSHKMINEESLTINEEKEGEKTYETYVVESIPRIEEKKIAKIKWWVDKVSHTPIRAEYSNHEGKIFKILESFAIRDIDGFSTVTKRVMTSPLADTKTEIFVNAKYTRYNIGIPEDIFTDRSLRNPPAKYLR